MALSLLKIDVSTDYRQCESQK